MAKQPLISISIVSHGQGDMVLRLLQSIRDYETEDDLEIIITENLLGESGFLNGFNDRPITKIVNDNIKSYAANHNQAFGEATGEYFCILNPDAIIIEPVFQALIENIENGRADIVAPLVVDSIGEIQDSYRPLPTPFSILIRIAGLKQSQSNPPLDDPIYPDWLAGIILFMRREIYSNLNGMDERYRMYFEDVDFSSRARIAGNMIMLDPSRKIVHDAQRSSRQNPSLALRHFSSGVRFFKSDVYKQVRDL